MELRAITNGIAECEERRVETTDMMLFNNGYGVTILNTSSMMDNTLQMMIQQSSTGTHSVVSIPTNVAENNSIFLYFSSAFEVSAHVSY